MVVSEFLAALGLKDNFSGPFGKTLKKGEQFLKKFQAATAKSFALAGVAVMAFLATVAAGLYKFSQKLLKTHDEINLLAKDLAISRDEAAATKSALDAMGKTLDEVSADERLLKQFTELKKRALEIQPPDMSEGLEQVRAINNEFISLKQTVLNGIQWIGHYFLKHVQKPMADFRSMMSGLNERIVKAMPVISENISKVMAWAARLITRVIQGGKAIWDVIARLLNMIPDKLKIVGLALLALNRIMKMGPFGIFMMLIAAAILLLDDFFTFMEGGESLFGDFWQKLVDSGAIENFKKAFESLETAFAKVMETLDTLLSGLFSNNDDAMSGIEAFLLWLLGTAIPSFLDGLGQVIGVVADALTWLLKIPGIIDVLKGLLVLFVAWKVAMMAIAAVQAIVAATNPATLIILGIVALISIIYLLIKNWDKVREFFLNLWTKIKEVFSGIGDWFREKFNQAKESVINAFISVVAWFAGIWQKIKDTFSGGDGFFSQLAGAWFRGVEAAFGIIVDWFKMIWENIKLIFSVVKSVLSGDFQGAYDGIVKIWGNIVGFFTNLVSRITGIFQPLIDWLLSKFGKVGEVISGMASKVGSFFSGGGKADVGGTPGHAEGGIFNKEHVARFAEGGQTEAVVPLTKPGRAAEVLAGIGKYLGLSGEKNNTDIAPLLTGLSSFVEKVSGAVGNMTQVLTGVQQVPMQPHTTNTTSSKEINQTNTINVYGSGDPMTTAKAVDNNQKNLIRNLQALPV